MRDGQCRHFNGIQNTCCKAGVNFNDLADGNRMGLALRLPCWTPTSGRKGAIPVECEKYVSVTEKEVADDKAATDTGMSNTRKVMLVVAEWRKKGPKGKREVIECPACGGKLHLSQSGYNGHVHGACDTDGCVRWME